MLPLTAGNMGEHIQSRCMYSDICSDSTIYGGLLLPKY